MKALGLLGLRVAVGIIFIYMGYSKLGPNHSGATALFSGLGFPGNGAAYVIGLLEFVGGALVLLGIFASYAATWLAVIMVVALLTVHRGGPVMGYFLPLAVLGGCLALMGCGAGHYRLVRAECHCPKCKEVAGKGYGCGAGAGGCGDKMDMKKCDCKNCCGGSCPCGAPGGMCACCKK